MAAMTILVNKNINTARTHSNERNVQQQQPNKID